MVMRMNRWFIVLFVASFYLISYEYCYAKDSEESATNSSKDAVGKIEIAIGAIENEIVAINNRLTKNAEEYQKIEDIANRLEFYEEEYVNISKYTMNYASVVIAMAGLIVVLVNSIFLFMGYITMKRLSEDAKESSTKLFNEFKDKIGLLERETEEVYERFLASVKNRLRLVEFVDKYRPSAEVKRFLRKEYDSLFREKIVRDLDSKDEDTLRNAIYHAEGKEEKGAIQKLKKITGDVNISEEIRALAEQALERIMESNYGQ